MPRGIKFHHDVISKSEAFKGPHVYTHVCALTGEGTGKGEKGKGKKGREGEKGKQKGIHMSYLLDVERLELFIAGKGQRKEAH